MKHKTNRFGTLEFSPDEAVTFVNGLLGFPEYRRFFIRSVKQTEPIKWLICLDDAAEFPILRPGPYFPKYPPAKARAEARELLGEGRLSAYCLLVLPRDLSNTTVNLRAPLFVNRDTGQGIQLAGPSLNHQPVAFRLYRELFTNFKGD